jgi:hypothetical protein
VKDPKPRIYIWKKKLKSKAFAEKEKHIPQNEDGPDGKI